MKKKLFNLNNWLSLFFFPFGILFLFIIISLRPLVLIRVGLISSYRFGHYLKNVELYLCDKKLNKESFGSIDIFFLSTLTCNNFIEKMCKRKIIIFPFQFINLPFLLFKRISKKLKFLKKNIIELRVYDHDRNNLLDKVECQIKFTKKEIDKGENLLRELGIESHEKIVCLSNRDDEYMKNYLLGNYDEEHKWKIRNSDIQSYALAAKELLRLGYTIVRVGKDTKEVINFEEEKIIDYSKSKLRSDFLDIYLAYRCEFAFGDSSGWINAPMTFRKHIAFANWTPISELHYYSDKFTFLLKHYFDSELNKKLIINDVFKRKLHRHLGHGLKKKNIKLIDNTPDEILKLVLEVESKYSNNFEYSTEYIKLNKDFKNYLIQNNFQIDDLTKLKKFSNSQQTFELKSNCELQFLKENFSLN